MSDRLGLLVLVQQQSKLRVNGVGLTNHEQAASEGGQRASFASGFFPLACGRNLAWVASSLAKRMQASRPHYEMPALQVQ